MNVTLYAICKNEEKNVEKFINNSKKFYHTVVVDTGSTDNTVQLLRDAGITVYEHPQSREEFDFSLARNQSLSYVETDWAFSLDFNEDVDNFNLVESFEEDSSLTWIKHRRFDNEDDNVTESHEIHVRFHRTKNYTWVGPVHEMPVFIKTDDISEEKIVDCDIHITKDILRSVDKELFYLSICERELKKNPKDSNSIFYIFNHHFKTQNYKVAYEYGLDFLNVTKPYFDPYRIRIFVLTSQILINMGDTNMGINFAFFAFNESLNLPNTEQFFGFLFESADYLSHVGKFVGNKEIENLANSFLANLESKKNIFNKNED